MMSEDALGTVVLLRNAAAHAGQIKRELAAIIQVCYLTFTQMSACQVLSSAAQSSWSYVSVPMQSSGALQGEWASQIGNLSDPAARVCLVPGMFSCIRYMHEVHQT